MHLNAQEEISLFVFQAKGDWKAGDEMIKIAYLNFKGKCRGLEEPVAAGIG